MNDSASLPFQTEVSSLIQKLNSARDKDVTLDLPLTLGSYCLIRLVGRGGMGDVYEVENFALKRREAIKFVRSRFLLNPKAIEHFQTEIEATAKLQHPNIVSVYNAGQFEGRPYMVMEFLEGQTVQQYVRRRMELGQPLTVKEAADIIVQAARGLQYAHEKGIVHRDVKPGNLWIDSNGKVKVLDLGLALATTHGTSKNQTVGTPDYMSPEQCSPDGTANPRSDIYSLGCTLFFILTGAVPFGGKEFSSSQKKMEAHRTRILPPLVQHRKGLPHKIQKVLNRMTAKDSADRYASMQEVIETLTPKPVEWKRILIAAVFVAICSAMAWGLGSKNKSVSISTEHTDERQTFPDVTGVFPVGKQAGEKLVRIVNGVEYVFRWCPSGSFLMGNHGTRITKEMPVDELLKIAKDDKLLDEDQIREFESRYEELERNRQTASDLQKMDLDIFLDLIKNDVYLELSLNSKVNTDLPPTETSIPRGFWILDCEVTRQMWFSVMPDNPANEQIRTLNESDLVPVRMASWQDAQDFCSALSARIGDNVKLPNEAQWEYACRAGEEITTEKAVSQSVSFADMLRNPSIVKSKAPNAWGIYDMSGNVKEWCSDLYGTGVSPSGSQNTANEEFLSLQTNDQNGKTVRGGCYLNRLEMEDFYSLREPQPVDLRNPNIGFRIIVQPKN